MELVGLAQVSIQTLLYEFLQYPFIIPSIRFSHLRQHLHTIAGTDQLIRNLTDVPGHNCLHSHHS